MNGRVLLTYGWVRSTYAAMRNLVSHGLEVVVADWSTTGMCQWSRYKKRFVKTPSPFIDEQGFISSLAGCIEQNDIGLYLPSHDETVIVAASRHLLPSRCRIPIASAESLVAANDKSMMQQHATACGISTPRRADYDSLEELREALGTLQTGRRVVRLRTGNSAKGVFYGEDDDETIGIVHRLVDQYRLSRDRLPVVQEFVVGEGWGVSSLFWEGEHIASFTHRRLREKITTGGTSTLREHAPNPMLEEMARVLLQSLRWHGLAMVEFKYDPVRKNGWFIEINPRLWGSLHLAVSAGVEFPYLLYLCASGDVGRAKEEAAKNRATYPWRSRWYLGDCLAVIDRIRCGRICDGFRLLVPGGTDTYDDISLDDPMAFAGEIVHYAGAFLKSGETNPKRGTVIG